MHMVITSRNRSWLYVFACIWLTACGASQGPTAPVPQSTSTGIRQENAGTLAIAESEIGRLSEEQQELLADAGWNQPYIESVQTPVPSALPAPSHEMLMELLRDQATRRLDPGTELPNRSASISGLGHLGSYRAQDVAENGVPDFGCNADPAQQDGVDIEDVIGTYELDAELEDFYVISNVALGISDPNYFVKEPLFNQYPRRITQYLASSPFPIPDELVHIAELCYLVPDGYTVAPGEGTGPGGPADCGLQAYSVRDPYWMTWNEKTWALPGGQTTALYNVLHGPLAEASIGRVNLASQTTAGRQPFHFGSWEEQYSTGEIIGIESANSGCENFDKIANLDWPERNVENGVPYPNLLHVPVYGLLHERWLQSAIPGAEDWQSPLGWPLTRSFAFQNGAVQLDNNGEYYAFGQYFERGFIWWLDYDQALNPESRDRAILYSFDGDNTFCEGSYQLTMPDLHYNDAAAPLAANLLIDLHQAGNGDWRQIDMDQPRRMLHLPWQDEGAGQHSATVRARVQPSGGVTLDGNDIGQPDWGPALYRSCTWLWHDGTITPAGIDYDPAQFEAVHTYTASGSDIEAIYTVRSQIVDADGNIAYTDSLPLQIGRSSVGAIPALTLIRNDQSRFPAGYEALVSDLGELGLPFVTRIWQPGLEAALQAEGCELAIWYQGGPGTEDELDIPMPDWTLPEIDSLRNLLSDNISVLLLSQNLGMAVPDEPGNAWLERFHFFARDPGLSTPVLAETWGQLPQGKLSVHLGSEQWLPAAPQNLRFDDLPPLEVVCSPVERGPAGTSANGAILVYEVSSIYPVSGLGHAAGWPGTAPQFVPGSYLLPGNGFGDYSETIPPHALLSWGSTAAPHTLSGSFPDLEFGSGNANFWVYGASWPATHIWKVSTLEYLPRSGMLGNMLGWLRPDSRYFAPQRPVAYDGEPEIVSVTPFLIDNDGQITAGSTARTGLDYPDPGGADVLRSSPGQPGDNYLQVDNGLHPAPEDGLNANDVDLQFPFYAYITWDDSMGQQAGTFDALDITAVSYGGLLLADDSDWQRADPFAFGYINPAQFLARPVAGYYLSVSGDSGDELRAAYGPALPQLATDKRRPQMLIEAIAHWPEDASYGGQTPYLRWCMYPGHKVYLQTALDSGASVAGYAGELPVPWQYFVRTHDIDPELDSAQLGRNNPSFLQSEFSLTSPAGGRSMLFDFADVRGFQSDLNGNAVLDDVDKFPVRVRLITDYARYGAYSGLDWPDAFPPADSFVEGGCYVSFRDYGCELIVMDDPELPDPAATLIKGDGEFEYDITFSFIIEGCNAPYDVELDWDYTGHFGESGHLQPLGTYPASGAWSDVAAVDFTPGGGAGNHYLAIQVIDGSIPANAVVYAWPEPVVIE